MSQASCCIPGCVNPKPEWVTQLPRDATLFERWLDLIMVGTGIEVKQSLPEALFQPEATICNVHFAAGHGTGQKVAADQRVDYCEPTLFFRDNIFIQVAYCELCLEYDSVDNMCDTGHCIVPHYPLRNVANKYFKISTVRDGFFCENCVVLIDMTHAFWGKVNEASKTQKKLQKIMEDERMVFQKVKPLKEMADKKPDVPVVNTEENLLEDVIVKEEARLADSEPEPAPEPEPEPAPVPEVNANVSEAQTHDLKCYICNKIFGSSQLLTEHFQNVHNISKKIYRCTKCKMSFAKANIYSDHLSMHDVKKPYKCRHCPLRFDWRRDMTLHEDFQHKGEVVKKGNEKKCPCGRTFRTLDALSRHRLMEHPAAPPQKKMKLEK